MILTNRNVLMQVTEINLKKLSVGSFNFAARGFSFFAQWECCCDMIVSYVSIVIFPLFIENFWSLRIIKWKNLSENYHKPLLRVCIGIQAEPVIKVCQIKTYLINVLKNQITGTHRLSVRLRIEFINFFSETLIDIFDFLAMRPRSARIRTHCRLEADCGGWFRLHY